MTTPETTSGTVSSSPKTTAAHIGQTVYFYSDHEPHGGMKTIDKLEPFAAIVAYPSNAYLGDAGSGFSVPVAKLVVPDVPVTPPPATAPTSLPTTATTAAPIMGTPLSATAATPTATATAMPAAPTTGPIATVGPIAGGKRYRNGTYTNVPLIGGTGTGAEATITVESGEVSSVVVIVPGEGYTVGDVLSAGVNDRLVNLLVIDHSGISFPFGAVPFFHGDDKDDKGVPYHCEAEYRRMEKPAPFAVVVPAPAAKAA
jgi:hypothetical protein